jgi:hypothetical protein
MKFIADLLLLSSYYPALPHAAKFARAPDRIGCYFSIHSEVVWV